MDDELLLLLFDAHHELGVLEGLFHAIPDSEVILKRLLLREVCFSLQIDNEDISLYEIIAKNLVDRFTLNQIRVLAQMPKGQVDFQMLHSIGKGLYQGTEKEYNGAFRITQVFLDAVVIMNMQRYNPTAPAEIQDAMQAMLKSCSMHYDCFFPLSEHLYYNKTEYFDNLSYVQNTGDYLPWIKFFVKGIEIGILQKMNSQARHRLFGYVKLLDGFEIKFDAEMTKSSGGTHEKNCYI